MEVKRHGVAATSVSIELWQAMSEAVAVGDAFTVTAGCDKQFSTCKAKFDNALNFRGFPYMPGNDAVAVVSRPAANLWTEAADMGIEEEVTSPQGGGKVVLAARAWIGTPYLHQASVKGAGCDCLGLLRGVWRELRGEEPEQLAALFARLGGGDGRRDPALRPRAPSKGDRSRKHRRG